MCIAGLDSNPGDPRAGVERRFRIRTTNEPDIHVRGSETPPQLNALLAILWLLDAGLDMPRVATIGQKPGPAWRLR